MKNDLLFRLARSVSHRTFMVWLFGDVSFAVIPLGIIAFINLLLGRGFGDFLLLKEWSFASIIFFGVSIRQLINLKVRVQRIPLHYTLDTGVQLYIVLLVGSALVLAFVVLEELGVVPRSISPLLAKSQFVMFAIGLISTFVAAMAAEDVRRRENTIGESSKEWALKRITGKLEDSNLHLQNALYMLESLAVAKFDAPSDAIRAQLNEDLRSTEFRYQMMRTKQLLLEVSQRADAALTQNAIGAATKVPG